MPGRVDELAAAFANYAQVRGGESGLQGRAQPLQEMVLAGRPCRGDDRIHGRVAQQSLLARCPRLPEASEHTLKARSQALDRPAGPLVSGVCLEIHSRDAQPLEGVAEQEKLRLDVVSRCGEFVSMVAGQPFQAHESAVKCRNVEMQAHRSS